MSSEQQPWWLPNPPRKTTEGRPDLGFIGSGIRFLLSVMPVLELIGLLTSLARQDDAPGGLDPYFRSLLNSDPVATIAIATLACLSGLYGGWLLGRGHQPRHLRQSVFSLWLVWPGQFIAFALLHWFALWRADIGIYDVWLRVQDIFFAALMAAMASAYLLLSQRMKQRFSPAADLAAVF